MLSLGPGVALVLAEVSEVDFLGADVEACTIITTITVTAHHRSVAIMLSVDVTCVAIRRIGESI